MTVPADPPTVPHPSAPYPSAPFTGGYGPPTPAPPPGRRRWWAAAAVIGWAVLLVVLAVFSVRRDPPTVPDQRDLADAVPAVDRAAGAVLAATAADAVVEFGPLVVTGDCRITPVRAGAEATRDVTVHVRQGDGPATLRALATALPAGYGAQVGRSGAGARQVLHADAGDFVAVRGSADDGGDVLNLRVSSGCRPTDGATTASPAPASVPPLPGLVAALPGLVAALGALGRGDRLTNARLTDAVSVAELRCPEGEVARTATVADAGPARADLDRVLDRITADATVVRSDPDRYAYRMSGESVVVAVVDGRLHVTATTTC